MSYLLFFMTRKENLVVLVAKNLRHHIVLQVKLYTV